MDKNGAYVYCVYCGGLLPSPNYIIIIIITFEEVFGGTDFNKAMKIGFISFNLSSLDKGC